MRVRRLITIPLILLLLALVACATTPEPTPIPSQPTPSEATPTIPEQKPPPSPSPTPSPTPSLSRVKVHFIDVGQGGSILIDYGETENHKDGGEKSSNVEAYLVEYIDGALEVMVATHPHADHIGGLIAVMDTFKVNQIWHNGDTSDSKTLKR